MSADNLVSVDVRPRLQLSPIAALTMALDGAAERGQPLTPSVIMECMPDGWGLCETRSVGALAAELLDALEPLTELHELGGVRSAERAAMWADIPAPCEVRECIDYGSRHTGACIDR